MKLLFLVLVLLLLQDHLPDHVEGIRLGKGLATLEELVRHHDSHVGILFVTSLRSISSRMKHIANGERSIFQGKVASLTKVEKAGNIDSAKKRASKVSNGSSSSKDTLPSIQEDYRGPRNHKPRHHKH